MKADIITIGDEILIGQITDTNSQWLAEKLSLTGFTVRQISSVADSKEHIFEILDSLKGKTDLVIMTGGLGPTEDDITKQVLADYFQTELVMNEDVLSDIKSLVKAKGSLLNERNIKQAEVPSDCRILRNKYGTAPVMWFEQNNIVYISMPAVPFEMKRITNESVLPEIKKKFDTPEIVHKTVLTFGLPESRLAELVQEWENNIDERIKVAYLPSPERIRIRLSMICKERSKAEQLIESEIQKLQPYIKEAVYAYGDLRLQDVLLDLFVTRKKTLSLAESCTGGKVSSLLVSVSGSSQYFKGGVVAYSDEIKNKLLAVPKDILETYGAVSKETVEHMLKGLKQLYSTDYVAAISGIAGPDGGTKEKPVGTVWIGVQNNEKTIIKKYTFGKLRDINIRLASSKTLDMIRKLMLGYYD